jgi:hypothetical protein
MCSNFKLSISCQVKDVINWPELVKVVTISERCMSNRFFYSISPIILSSHISRQIRFMNLQTIHPVNIASEPVPQQATRVFRVNSVLLQASRGGTSFLAPKRDQVSISIICCRKIWYRPGKHPNSYFPLCFINLFSFWPVFIFAPIINVHIARFSVFNLLRSNK